MKLRINNYFKLVLCACMVICFASLLKGNVFAEGNKYGDFEYSIIDGEMSIKSYLGNDIKVTVPDKINDITVTKIGPNSFEDNTSIVSVVLPDGITSIGSHAFSGCVNLEEITMLDHVTLIDSYAFSNCKKLTNIDLSNSIKTINSKAFYGSGIMDIVIPNSINSISTEDSIGMQYNQEKYKTDPISGFVIYGYNDVAKNYANQKNITYIDLSSATYHNAKKSEYKKATCTTDGHQQYWYCNICRKYYSDENETNEITKDSVVIPATGHSWNMGKLTKQPTETEDGVKTYTCLNDSTHSYTVPVKLSDVPKTHNVFKVCQQSATCKKAGNIDYWYCSDCHKCYSDKYEQCEISREDTVVGKPLGHDMTLKTDKYLASNATYTKPALYYYSCSRCGEQSSKTYEKGKPLSKVANSISVENVSKVASGTTQAFNLNAKVKGGKVTYSSDNKNVTVDQTGNVAVAKNYCGIAHIKVKAGNEKFSTVEKSVTITIIPETVELSKLSSKKSSQLVAKWKKKSIVSGYELQYCTKKTFSKKATKTLIVKGKYNSKTITKLNADKEYYVRIRPYKKMSNNKIYGKWSKTKAIKVKGNSKKNKSK